MEGKGEGKSHIGGGLPWPDSSQCKRDKGFRGPMADRRGKMKATTMNGRKVTIFHLRDEIWLDRRQTQKKKEKRRSDRELLITLQRVHCLTISRLSKREDCKGSTQSNQVIVVPLLQGKRVRRGKGNGHKVTAPVRWQGGTKVAELFNCHAGGQADVLLI